MNRVWPTDRHHASGAAVWRSAASSLVSLACRNDSCYLSARGTGSERNDPRSNWFEPVALESATASRKNNFLMLFRDGLVRGDLFLKRTMAHCDESQGVCSPLDMRIELLDLNKAVSLFHRLDHLFLHIAKHRDESRCGTHECVRHGFDTRDCL